MFMLLEFLVGIVLGVGAGTAVKAIISGGGVIVGNNNIRHEIEREERKCIGKFNNLQVCENDPKFYE